MAPLLKNVRSSVGALYLRPDNMSHRLLDDGMGKMSGLLRPCLKLARKPCGTLLAYPTKRPTILIATIHSLKQRQHGHVR